MGRGTCNRQLGNWMTVFLCAAILLVPVAVQADPSSGSDGRMPGAPLNEEVLSLAGDPARPVSLEVTLFKPTGPGPFPLAVMNHGATNASAFNRGERYRFTTAAYYFLSRGYAVALPMLRGFAGSGGSLLHLGCDLKALAENNARDIRAVIETVALRPEIDRTRIVVAGQSYGGWNTLGVGADPPAGVRGLIGFNPAIRASDCGMQDASMARAASQLGAQTSLPSLWFYGDNDSVMPVATWRAVFDRYKQAGARAELVDFGSYKNDSHQLLSFPEGMPLWAPKVDAFLSAIGLPSHLVNPAYLPTPAPPSSHFADILDVAAVPFLTEQGRVLYRRFLDTPQPRAFVIGPNGAASQSGGGYDPLGFALRSCNRQTFGQCRPYAVDNAVVWTGPKQTAAAALLPRVVGKIVPMNVSTSLGAFFDVNPDCSSRGLPKVVVDEMPTHGTAVVGPHDERPAFPAASPFAACNAVAVPANGLTYTPAPGYAGDDALTIEKIGTDGKRQIFRLELRVM